MFEAKFTKGPWVARGSTPSRIYGMFRADKEVLVAACGSVIEQAGANAHLIAAAPEMYEMLERFLPYSTFDENGDEVFHGGDFHWNEDDDPMIEELKQILAKARGEHV